MKQITRFELYRSILNTQPGHPDANHNLGVLVAGTGKPSSHFIFQIALDSILKDRTILVKLSQCADQTRPNN